MQVTDTSVPAKPGMSQQALRADVLAHFQTHPGAYYRVDNLSEKFGTGTASMRNLLLLLLGEGRIRQSSGNSRVSYYVPTNEQLLIELRESTGARPFKPLKRGIGMYENINRAKEAREQYKSIG